MAAGRPGKRSLAEAPHHLYCRDTPAVSCVSLGQGRDRETRLGLNARRPHLPLHLSHSLLRGDGWKKHHRGNGSNGQLPWDIIHPSYPKSGNYRTMFPHNAGATFCSSFCFDCFIYTAGALNNNLQGARMREAPYFTPLLIGDKYRNGRMQHVA